MKNSNKIATLIIMMFIFFSGVEPVFAFSQKEYNLAQEIFKTRKEICFKFYINSMEDLKQLPLNVNIDRINGIEVKAYAFKEPFEEFVKLGLDFEVLSPVNVQEPEMLSDLTRGSSPITKYPTYSAYVSLMNGYATNNPDKCKIVNFGKSVKGKDFLAAVISSNVATHGSKPKFFVYGAIHGNELTGYSCALSLIDFLLGNYGKDAKATKIVDSIEMWINPLGNPDGTFAGGDNSVSGATRANSQGTDINRTFAVPNPDATSDASNKLVSAVAETKVLEKIDSEQKFVMAADFHTGVECVVYPWGCWKKLHADDAWWKKISNNYVASARTTNSNYMKYTSSGIINGAEMYIIQGERMNSSGYFNHCKAITFELNNGQGVGSEPENKIQTYWGYNKDALLNMILESLNGIRGTITDSVTGKPIVTAKITIPSHDKDSSEAISHEFGDYYRPILAGTYDIEFSAKGYDKKTVTGIKAVDGQATVLNVKLFNPSTAIQYVKPTMDISCIKGMKHFTISNSTALMADYTVFNVNGKKIASGSLNPKSQITWNASNASGAVLGAGKYFLVVKYGGQQQTHDFILVP